MINLQPCYVPRLRYSMCVNFQRIYILRISYIHGFHIFKFADAGHSGVQILTGEIFMDKLFSDAYLAVFTF